MENLLLDFDAALKKKGNDALKQICAPISALALSVNEVDTFGFNNEDGEKVQALAGIMGDALPGAIAAINHADEMKADTEILDLPLAIKYFLEWSSDLPEYGMECNKGVLGAKELLEKAKSSGESKLRKKTGKDPWGWAKRLKDYSKRHVSHARRHTLQYYQYVAQDEGESCF
ncbi:hypothetical protein HBI24_212490 [Parastagonospora nodorum]|uniref:Uncharacterized protein n=1 Tax=Phaeosphaeria nodorum (strain SN15 / ATCC MYA-4574 / FGSC 10173) TaxID=321614 RepID=A0A7U2EZK1_PHANO|nr:hypothetical protein HBH86_204980 [Parastagonospora nodorum]QRC93890.1 hypothetical protein JI435_156070 [Parastagonospora nodorum SN15]KAH4957180.1 hypothetical protein HBI78_192510 [Parastagonospora nodorum]KAH5358751.1 hypothetical protein HBI33_199510 [Parastagonospora nodorum]KAH5494744.1 hypothetical protein HBI52_200240 [Parastagonospora nodorum]